MLKMNWPILSAAVGGVVVLAAMTLVVKSAMVKLLFPMLIIAIGGYLLYTFLLAMNEKKEKKEETKETEESNE